MVQTMAKYRLIVAGDDELINVKDGIVRDMVEPLHSWPSLPLALSPSHRKRFQTFTL